MSEHTSHLRECNDEPVLDTVVGRSRYEVIGKIHVCEHVASSIRKRLHFVGCTVRDRGAIDEIQIACRSCEADADNGEGPGDRHLACYACFRALELPRGWRGLDGLAPRREESFESWHSRVGTHLPNVPNEVAKEWIHRHWGHSSYEWMPLLDLRFSLEQWSLARVLEVAVGARGRPDRHEVRENPGEWLKDYMNRHGTWPTPIIVLEGGQTLRDDLHDLQLLEGHRRLGYLRVSAMQNACTSEHAVWVVRST